MKFSKDFTKIRGDASLREFYRNHKNKTIIIFAKKEKNKNLLIYDAINKILIKNNIIAPQLVSQNYLKNYIEVEDLGTKSIYQLLNNKKTNNYLILVEVLKVLKSIQLIKDKKIKNFKKKFIKLKNIKIIFYLMRQNFSVIGMCLKSYQKKNIFHLILNLKKKSDICCLN